MFRLFVKIAFVFTLVIVCLYGLSNVHHFSVRSQYSTHKEMRDDAGNLLGEYNEDADKKFYGQMLQYHPNGEISTISEWDHGYEIGKKRHFNKAGEPID